MNGTWIGMLRDISDNKYNFHSKKIQSELFIFILFYFILFIYSFIYLLSYCFFFYFLFCIMVIYENQRTLKPFLTLAKAHVVIFSALTFKIHNVCVGPALQQSTHCISLIGHCSQYKGSPHWRERKGLDVYTYEKKMQIKKK